MGDLLIAVGNPLRGDDGAAAHVVRQLPPAPQREVLEVIQLLPELAAVLWQHDRVVIIDADITASEPTLEPLEINRSIAGPPAEITSHGLRPQQLLALARDLFAFAGRALLCRVPARDFSLPHQLSDTCVQATTKAARLIDDRTAPPSMSVHRP